LMTKRGTWPSPLHVRIGAMVEVPSLLFELDALMPRVDFVSVGSNDLMQFMFAADRGNSRVANRYDALSVPALRALQAIVAAGEKHGKPVTLCGELAGRPLSAMALIGLGFRSISMSPAAIGPVKAMLRSLDASRLAERMNEWLATRTGSLRSDLHRFAEGDSIEL
jgi:phosphotransferase system, enzyme I, PtsP